MGERFESTNGSSLPATTQDGSSVTFAAGQYVLTERNGTKWTFSSSLANPKYKYGDPLNGWPEKAKLVSITYPTGEALAYAYDPVPADSYGTAYIRSITSNLGYQLHITGSWIRPQNVVLLNLGTDFCDPYAATCSGLSRTWPQVSASYDATGGAAITDAAARTTTFTGWRRDSSSSSRATITSPAGVAFTMYNTIVGFSSLGCPGVGLISRVTTGGSDWRYSYQTGSQSPNCGVDSTSVIAPDGSTRAFSGSVGTHVKTDGLGRRTTVTLPTLTPTYSGPSIDGDTGLLSIAYSEGNNVAYTYDTRFNVTKITQTPKSGGGQPIISLQAGYDASCSATTVFTCNKPNYVIDANGNRTDYSYHQPSGQIAVETQPVGVNGVRPQKRYSYVQLQAVYYTGAGQRTASGIPVWKLASTSICQTQTACAGTADEVITRYAYNDNLLPTVVTVAGGDGSFSRTINKQYNEAGDVVAVDGPMPGAADTTYYVFNVDRELVGTILPDPDGGGPLQFQAVRTTYNADGQPVTIEKGELASLPSSGTAPANWSNFNLLEQIATSYDAYGRKVLDKTNASGSPYTATQYSYDAVGRLECTAIRMNAAAFNALPVSACTLGAEGAQGPDRITRQVYDAAGQLTKAQKAYGTSLQQDYVSYSYSPNGKQTSVRDANGNLATMAYDGFDRQTAWNFPSATSAGQVSTTDYEAYGYDAAGNRTSLRKRDGRTIAYAYDNLNRVSSKTYPQGGARGVYYSYDVRGLQTAARFDGPSGGDAVTATWDGFGQQATSTTAMGGVSRTLNYTYDANGARTRVTHPDGTAFNYERDAYGRLTAVRDGGGGLLTIETYYPNGLPGWVGYGANGTGYSYDSIQRLSSYNFQRNQAGTIVGDITGLTYNPASQITQQNRSSDAYAWTGALNVDRSYTVNGLNQYANAGSASFQYDANGNLISDGTTTYAYDIENRLLAAGGGRSATLTYDPLGRLWNVVGNSTTRQLLYDGDALVAEYDANGGLLDRYVHGDGADQPLLWFSGAGGAPRQLMADHQGSIVGITQHGWSLIGINSYDEYGIPASSNMGRFQYTGQAWLPELGMYYYKARVYSPTLGRFLQTDPIGYDDQINLYAYVANDPVNKTDPTGDDSFVVGRPLDSAAAAALDLGHTFIAVDAKYPGDPNARIISFGKLADGNMGNVNNSSRAADMSKTAHATDVAAWRSLAGAKTGSFSKIDSPDKVVSAVANSVSETNKYSIVPRVTSPFGGDVNSNSAARAVADSSTGISGGKDTPKPAGLGLPGWNESGRVKIDGAKLCSNPGIQCH